MGHKRRKRMRQQQVERNASAFIESYFKFAPIIEAAGSLDRALAIGVAKFANKQSETLFREFVPVSRGGTWSDPDADAEWQILVRNCVANDGLDLEKMRAKYHAIDTRTTPQEGGNNES